MVSGCPSRAGRDPQGWILKMRILRTRYGIFHSGGDSFSCSSGSLTDFLFSWESGDLFFEAQKDFQFSPGLFLNIAKKISHLFLKPSIKPEKERPWSPRVKYSVRNIGKSRGIKSRKRNLSINQNFLERWINLVSTQSISGIADPKKMARTIMGLKRLKPSKPRKAQLKTV
jgi:hypothetical protein